MNINNSESTNTQSCQTAVSDSILYQVVYGMKSHHHNSFEDLRFHPNFFNTKEEAKKFIGEKRLSTSGVSYFIFECF